MLGRSIVLLLLIGIISVGGAIWFDYLNVIDAKEVLAPIYKHIPFLPGQVRSQPKVEPDEFLNLDAERLTESLYAMELQNLEIDTRQKTLDTRNNEIEQMAQELEEQRKAVEDMQNSLRMQTEAAEDKNRNVEKNARILTGMPPRNAVGIIAQMDDQDAIDVLRKTDEIALAEGAASIVPFWFSLMDPARAAVLQRKMANRPTSL